MVRSMQKHGFQPFWGSRVAAIGAGPKPVPINKLTSHSLMAALEQADSDPIRRRAKEIANQIQAENGVSKAVALIENHEKTLLLPNG